MNRLLNTNLLRRTTVALAAVATLFIAAPAAAQTYNCTAGATVSVLPTGSVAMTCATTGTTPTLAVTVVSSASSAQEGAAVTLTATANMSGNVNISAQGCTTNVTSLAVGTASQTFTATGTTGSTSCTVQLSDASNNTLVGQAGFSVTPIGGGGGGTGTAGCPAPGAGSQSLSFAAPGMPVPNGGALGLRSGQIAYMPLPNTSPYPNAAINMAYTAISPKDPALYEISISKCPGVIASGTGADPAPATVGTTQSCYRKSSNSTLIQLKWYQQTGIADPTYYCVADLGGGPWYVNVRYTYSNCPYGTCGEQVLWNY